MSGYLPQRQDPRSAVAHRRALHHDTLYTVVRGIAEDASRLQEQLSSGLPLEDCPDAGQFEQRLRRFLSVAGQVQGLDQALRAIGDGDGRR